MDILTYMESGIIESYCLGQLNSAQTHDLQLMAQRYPEVQTEITRTYATLRGLAIESVVFLVSQNVPDGLLKIWIGDTIFRQITRQLPRHFTI